MAPRIQWTRTKRLLEENHDEGQGTEKRMEEVCDGNSFSASVTEAERTFSTRGTNSKIRSRRWKQTSEPAITKIVSVLKSNEVANNLDEHRDKRVRNNQKGLTVMQGQSLFADGNVNTCNTNAAGQSSYSFGQASYQRNREGNGVSV